MSLANLNDEYATVMSCDELLKGLADQVCRKGESQVSY